MRVGSARKGSSPTSCFQLEFCVYFILGHVQKELPLWHKQDFSTPFEVFPLDRLNQGDNLRSYFLMVTVIHFLENTESPFDIQ